MSVIKVDMDIDRRRYKYSVRPEQLEVYKANRQKSVISKQNFNQMLREGKLVQVNPKGSNKPVYMYNAKMDLNNPYAHDLYAIQFYTAQGDLIMTYPWNGETARTYRNEEIEFVDRYGDALKGIAVAATTDGSILIQTKEQETRGPLINPSFEVGKPVVYQAAEGYRPHNFWGIVGFAGAGIEEFDLCTEEGLEKLAECGDNVINDLFSNSYVI